MSTYHLDPATKAELHSEAEKLIARYESPLETVKALMAYNCELETQILAIAIRTAKALTGRHAGVIAWSREANPSIGEYGEPKTLFVGGEVPDME